MRKLLYPIFDIGLVMNRLLPALVICGALLTALTGFGAFSHASGVWDLLFLISVITFVAVFLMLLRVKAASSIR